MQQKTQLPQGLASHSWSVFFQNQNGRNVPTIPDNWHNKNFRQTSSDSSFPALRAYNVGNSCSHGLKNSCGTGFTVLDEWTLSCPCLSPGSLFYIFISVSGFSSLPHLTVEGWSSLGLGQALSSDNLELTLPTLYPSLSSSMVRVLFRQTQVYMPSISLPFSVLDLCI